MPERVDSVKSIATLIFRETHFVLPVERMLARFPRSELAMYPNVTLISLK